jgi:hypothetical protein
MSSGDSTNKVLAYTLGPLLIGPATAVLCPLVVLWIYGAVSNDSGDGLGFALIAGIVLPFLAPVPLLLKPGTRPWGVGILIGVALTVIVLGGICAGFIYLLNNESG